MQKLKELIKLSNLCNFQLFASSIEGNYRHQKLRNCWVAKRLMSRTSTVKFRVFRRELGREVSGVVAVLLSRKCGRLGGDVLKRLEVYEARYAKTATSQKGTFPSARFVK